MRGKEEREGGDSVNISCASQRCCQDYPQSGKQYFAELGTFGIFEFVK